MANLLGVRTLAGRSPGRRWTVILLGLAMVAGSLGVATASAVAACGGNAIVCENQLPGTPKSQWDIDGVGDESIQGYATQISVNAGSRVDFKIKTDARSYSIKIYRLGYYQGSGAREVATVNPSVALPQTQPACATDPNTDLYDCGTWKVSASWQVPANAVSGVYIARPIRSDTQGDSHIVFVVRNDGNTSDVLFQTSDSTWHAYNLYGGANFYRGGTNRTQAVKVSYNRPFATRGGIEERDFLFSNEYPMIRFLEQNGYDVSYVSGLDVSTDPALLPKHKVFLSVGHDEYWSREQRANVTAARDQGVNLAFFSGNEVYWKTRWEPSQDGSSTPNRTYVTYKDTWANVRSDPVEATPTWRDPRFGDLGFGPENGLTGTLYMSNNTDLPITVSAEEGKLRLWRNTSLSSLATGQSAALANHTVGYESNEDLDNGSRPDGLIRLSTTTGPTPEYLQDFGNIVLPGTTTHHLTLYKAPSGAMVFSAGTVQWAWGLDAVRDGTAQAADPRMRQATANILADMKALPTTLASDLVMPTTSTDTTGPTVVITQPAANSDLTQGTLVTVKGTASDVGGRVAGVEVSVDGGLSFHPATGTTSWSYSGILTGNGASAIQVRAMDDSANIGATANLKINAPCPCTLFGSVVPATPDAGDGSNVTLGTKFSSSKSGVIMGVRFYKAAANTGTHTGTLYSSVGDVLATGTFTNETATGWQTLMFDSAVSINANTEYVAAYNAPNGHYAAQEYGLASKYRAGTLTAPGGLNGVYASGNGFPTESYHSTNYWVDVVYSETDDRPVTVNNQYPLPDSNSILTNVSPSGVLSREVAAGSVVASVVDGDGVSVQGSVNYSATSRKVTFNPTQALAPGKTYTVTIGADGMAAPASWSFTTVQTPSPEGTCPCSVFTDANQPTGGPDTDTVSVTLGMAFHPTTDGVVNGVRFFKNVDNYGARKVALWSSSGSLLAEAVPATESPAGWQQVNFASPVSVTKNTTYIVSYVAPRGRYAYTSGGLGSGITRGPLTTESNGGRYTYGSGAPTSTSSANYFVDVVFNRAALDAPTVTAIAPTNGATSVPISATVQATFSTEVTPGITNVKVTKHSNGSVVPGVVGNESQGSLVTFQPSQSLEPGTRYDVEVSGATNLAGTPMSGTFTSSFTTSGATSCPCSLLPSGTIPGLVDSNDASALTLGLKFSSTVNGKITGLRYYRAAANTGVHKGALWTSGGEKLAELTFTDGAPGWTTANFGTPVTITAGSTYVASYYAPNGHYSADLNYYSAQYVNTPLQSVGAGGVYTYSNGFPDDSYRESNYYVDVLFDTTAEAPPAVSAVTPAANQESVPLDATVTATFDSVITESTLNMVVQTVSDGVAVPGLVTYASSSKRATFTPATALVPNTRYRATVTANSGAGVAMAAPKVWEFTTTTAFPASVSTITPLDAAVDVDTTATVTATFSESTRADSVSLKLTKGLDEVPGAFTYDTATRVATFTPSAPLASATEYKATATASNTDGVPMSVPKVWTFTTKDTEPVTFGSLAPANDASGVAKNSKVSAVASKAIAQASLSLTVRDHTGATVAGTTSYNATTRKATFTPSAALATEALYTATVSADSAAGVPMVLPTSWSFTTGPAGACPCSLLPTDDLPDQIDSGDAGAVTLGLRFTSDVDGFITGLRYYRAAENQGTHKGTLWTAAGEKLAELTFTDAEPGWTTASFSAPVAVTANTTYVASYFAPQGHYSATSDAFVVPLANAPLRTVDTGSVYVYADAFPTSSWRFTNYFVDVVFNTAPDMPEPAAAPAGVTAVTPLDAAVEVDAAAKVTATFSESTKADSVSLKVTKGSDNVPGAVSYDPATRVATFTPSDPLGSATEYKATATASNTDGVAMTSPKVWTFKTKDTQPVTFGSLSPANNATGVARTAKVTAVASKTIDQASLVVILKSETGATVAGSTAYNATNRTVTFTPSAQLGIGVGYTATVTAKNTSGVAMPSPTTWSFTTIDTAAPVVSSTTPAASATGVPLTQKVTATFAKSIDPSTLTMSLSPTVAGSTSYDAATRTATFTPNASLASSTTYTASVRARSTGGTNMSSAKTWSFTTTTADYSMFASTATPATQAVTTTTATTVGMRFSSNRAGKVVAIKYWAASTNTGTTVTLRNTSGTVLGTATTGTGTGWRTATFSTPINITAGTTYVASYYAPAGRWAVTNSAFTSAVTNGPLTIPASGGRTGNGNVNPTTTTTNNMWVDVVVRI